MELIPNQWIYPSSMDTLQQIIMLFSRPEELKEKLFYLSLFVNADMIKKIAILYHKVVYQFKNIEEFILNFTNNKYQVSNYKNYWFDDYIKYLKTMIDSKKNHISFFVTPFYNPSTITVPGRFGHYFYGIFINNKLDMDKIKSISITNGNEYIHFDLTKPFIINKYGKMFRLKNVPLFVLSEEQNYVSVDTTYDKLSLFNSIQSCTILSPHILYEPGYFKIKKADGSYDLSTRGFYSNYNGNIADFNDVPVISLL